MHDAVSEPSAAEKEDHGNFDQFCPCGGGIRSLYHSPFPCLLYTSLDWKKGTCDAGSGDLLSSGLLSSAGTSAADWYAFSVGRCGFEEDRFSYLSVLKQEVQKRYASSQRLDARKATEWHRIALTVLALGGDPTVMRCV